VSGRDRLCYMVNVRKRVCSRLFVYDRVCLCVLVILIRSIACFTLSDIVSNRLVVKVRRVLQPSAISPPFLNSSWFRC
jgi:hypothetical protein